MHQLFLRRTWRWLIPLLLTAGLMQAAPGHAKQMASGTITISVWDNLPFSDLSQHLDKIDKAFELTHPNIKLNLLHNQSTDKTLAAVAAGNGPDIINPADGSASLATYAANGVIQPLDKYIAASHFDLKSLFPAGLQQASWHGHVWGMPTLADTWWLWYNMDDFRAAGLDPNRPPRTLQEAMADGIKLTKRTGSGRLLRLGYLPPFYYAESGGFGSPVAFINGNDVNPYGPLFGATLYNADGTKVTPDSPAQLAAWHEMRNEAAQLDTLYGHDQVFRFVTSFSAPFTPQEAFLSDRVSMKLDGDWVPQNVRDYKPTWKYGVDYAAAPIPAAPGYQKFYGHQPVSVYPLLLSSHSAHPAEAFEYMAWLQSVPLQAQQAAYLYNLPQTRATLDSPELTKLPGFGQIIGLLRTKVTLVSDANSPITSQYYPLVNSYTDAILTGRTTPESAMKAVRERMQPMLDKIMAKVH